MNQFNEKINHLIDRYCNYIGAPPFERLNPLTEKTLENWEHSLGYSLPSTYREFLREYGNTPSVGVLAVFYMAKQEEAVHYSYTIDAFYGIVSKSTFASDLIERYRKMPGIVPHEWLPIAFFDYKNFFLSLAGDDVGSIYFLDGIKGTAPTKDNIYFLAKSFDEFLNQLEPYPM